jgi:hypothetical protein
MGSSACSLAGFELDALIEIGASTVVLWELSGTGAHLDRKNLATIPGFFLACYVLGALGSLAIAAWMNGRTRDFVSAI